MVFPVGSVGRGQHRAAGQSNFIQFAVRRILEACRFAVAASYLSYSTVGVELNRGLTRSGRLLRLGSPFNFLACPVFCVVCGFLPGHRAHLLMPCMAQLALRIDLPFSDNHFHGWFAIVICAPETILFFLPFTVVFIASLRNLYIGRLTVFVQILELILHAIGVLGGGNVPLFVASDLGGGYFLAGVGTLDALLHLDRGIRDQLACRQQTLIYTVRRLVLPLLPSVRDGRLFFYNV